MPISWQPADPRCRKHLASANRVGLALACAGGASPWNSRSRCTRGARRASTAWIWNRVPARRELSPAKLPPGAFKSTGPRRPDPRRHRRHNLIRAWAQERGARGSRTLRDASVGGRHWRKAISTSDGNRSSSRALKKSGSKVCIRYSGRRRPAQMLGDCEDDGERGRKQ